LRLARERGVVSAVTASLGYPVISFWLGGLLCAVILLVESLFSLPDLRQERPVETCERSVEEPLRLHQLRLGLHDHREPSFQLLVRDSGYGLDQLVNARWHGR